MLKHVPRKDPVKLGLSFLLLCFVITGCQTIKMPTGPDVSRLTLLPSAPLVEVRVTDARAKDKIGTIGATQIIAKRSETSEMARNLLVRFLYDQGVNSMDAPQIDFDSIQKISEVLERFNAQGMMLFEITKIKVSSIDLILDNPQYEITASVIIYLRNGKMLFHEDIHAMEESRSLTASGEGRTISRILSRAIHTLGQNHEFRQALESLKVSV